MFTDLVDKRIVLTYANARMLAAACALESKTESQLLNDLIEEHLRVAILRGEERRAEAA